ncbi:MAG: hypothetical protein OJF59_002392 [Cytophagales bacterium]|nr:MAG: hypothetical protein OJF59_002392 [Cytophagales bacterium]
MISFTNMLGVKFSIVSFFYASPSLLPIRKEYWASANR